ncbi:hypothetical protein TrVE_jg3686 [Triparma verrucosa]|uniref:Sperm-tail PG-rich repeat-containing protein 2 n=1 Tax=Triparma verrucosa TaxID=1606542 RepID=A0A9W7CEF7_9STRA|nr:hypothetical protein TrVE_jg3686 [Triparma verrucosa]
MTITSRADRQSDMALTTTDPVTGPGSYNLLQDRSNRQNFTGFGNSEPRGSIANVDPRASRLPGPGQYGTTLAVPEVSSADGANFKSTSRRLAPSITGSSAYMASTIAENPGPGTYGQQSSMQMAMSNGARSEAIKYGLKRASSVTKIMEQIPRQYNPPAIPQKMQTFGYVTQERDGFTEVRPVPPPSQMIMGTKGDTVGPGAYEQFVGKGIKPELPSSFANSKTKRNVFEPAVSSDRENPGPGVYEGKGFSWDRGGTGAFRSNTKMAHQMSNAAEKETQQSFAAREGLISAPGPGNQPVANFGKHGDVTAYNQEKYNLVQSFGTTAVRDTCPRVDRSFSFASRANSYSDRLVGPGSYNTNLMSDFTKKQQKTLRPTPVGFNGTAERPCLRKSDSRKSLSAPGPSPAQYNPDYFTLAHSAEKAAMSSRKIGVFGTTGPRFRPKNDIEAEAERTELNVGPGSYEHEPVVERVIVQHHKQFVSNFKPQHRYVEGEEINKGGKGFVLLGSQAAKKGSVMSYRDMPHESSSGINKYSDFNMKDDDTVERHKKAVRPSFGSSAKRGAPGVNIDGSKFKDTPGPQYHSKINNISRKSRYRQPSTFQKDGRKFETGNKGPASLGPGSYNIPSSINSHSFNITLKAKNKQYIKRSSMAMIEREHKRNTSG